MAFNRIITKELFEPKRDLSGRRLLVDRDSGTISARVYSFGQKYSTNDKISAPRNVNVEAAHIGEADDIEAGFKVGNLAMHVMHAGDNLTAAQAAEWYNQTETAIARGRYSIDDDGVRFDGVLYDDIDDAKLDRLTASAPSGDWRWKAGSMIRKPQDMEHAPCDFVGACMVNVPGFSSTYSQSPMTPMRLVASAESEEMVLLDTSLVAAADGVTQEDVQRAWSEAHQDDQAVEDDEMAASEYGDSWIEEFFVDPRKIIATDGMGGYIEAAWDIADDGSITFGAEIAVEETWVPKETKMTDETLTAAAGECGDGECCGGTCKGGAEKKALQDAAALVAANAEALGLGDEAVAALTAASQDSTASSATDMEALREDLNALAQVVYDAILSM